MLLFIETPKLIREGTLLSEWTEEKQTAIEWVDAHVSTMAEMSDTIFRLAEPGLREYKSAKLLVNYLKQQGFEVKEGVADMPTAFVAAWGEKRPEIGFFAEYDATPGHSQKPVCLLYTSDAADE